MLAAYDPKAAKKPINLSINGDLLRHARELGINLSATLEQALANAVRQGERERWLNENQSAIAHYNARVEEHGVFSDGIRRF